MYIYCILVVFYVFIRLSKVLIHSYYIFPSTNRNCIFDLSTVAFVNTKNKTKTIETPLPELPVNVQSSIVDNLKKVLKLDICNINFRVFAIS